MDLFEILLKASIKNDFIDESNQEFDSKKLSLLYEKARSNPRKYAIDLANKIITKNDWNDPFASKNYDITLLNDNEAMKIHSNIGDVFVLFKELCKNAKMPLDRKLNFLDFGGGSGRLTQWINRWLNINLNIELCDVNKKALNYVKSNYKNLKVLDMEEVPPLNIKSNRYDLILCYSIFTHYPENLHLKWLDELNRILNKDGILAITIKSKERIDSFLREKKIQELSRKSYDELREDFIQKNYLFFDSYSWINERTFKPFDSSNFGDAIISKSYIESEWTKNFKIIRYEKIVDGWQDIVFLQKA